MPAPPTTGDEFLDLVRRSGLVDATPLLPFEQEQRDPKDPRDLAEAMVRGRLLTQFQANQLLRGKWKGFFISGKYRLLEHLGSGGMGRVFLAEHVRMRRLVALKMLPDQHANNPSALERFDREARAVAALKHPNIVQAYDIDQDGRLNFLVMEYVDGVSLDSVIDRCGALQPVRAAHCIAQAAQGLQHAHDVGGLVHRDIKPSNLLLDRSGTVKILDLGLARFFYDTKDRLTKEMDERTILGTADFLAPEQATDSHAADVRSDIYSLGATCYFLLTGRTPLGEGSVTQKLLWVHVKEPTPIRTLNPAVPAEMEAVVRRMLAKDPSRRYQLPIQVAEALAPWMRTPAARPSDEEVPVRFPSLVPPGRVDTPSSNMPTNDLAGGRRGPGPVSPVAPVTDPATAWSAGGDESASSTVEHDDDSLFSDLTPAAAAAGTLRVRPPPLALETPQPGPRKGPFPWRLGLLAGGVGVALIALGIVYVLQTGEGNPSTTGKGPRRPALLLVDRSGEGDRYPSIRAALEKAIPGDHIVVREETWEETLQLTQNVLPGGNVWIEGRTESGKPVAWKPPADHPDGRPLLEVNGVSGVRFENFELDGQGKCDNLVVLAGLCPGLELGRLRLQGYRRAAVRTQNLVGLPNEKPDDKKLITLTGLRTLPAEGTEALRFEAAPGQLTRHVLVRDGRFDGPAKAAFVFSGEAADVVIENCRVADVRVAVVVLKRDPVPPVHFTFSSPR